MTLSLKTLCMMTVSVTIYRISIKRWHSVPMKLS
jgi:hypothetical protein